MGGFGFLSVEDAMAARLPMTINLLISMPCIEAAPDHGILGGSAE